MENMDQTIPFVVLVAVGTLLLVLLRRKESLPNPGGRGAGGEGTTTLPIPQIVAAPTPLTVEALPPVVVLKPRKKRTKPAAKPAQPTPIDTVAGLLQQKDTLAAAFLLREIFDRPVSQR
jgi:hypothetical protein